MTRFMIVYSNDRNIGDQFSARGIAHQLGGSSVLVPFERRLGHVRQQLLRAPSDVHVVVGGGGLFKAPFTPFWDMVDDVLVRRGRDFSIWGVGMCRERHGETFAMPRSVIDAARVVAVRDARTAEFTGRDDVIVARCPSHSVLRGYRSVSSEETLLEVDHPTLLDQFDIAHGTTSEFHAACASSANDLGLRHDRTNNLVRAGSPLALRRYERLLRRRVRSPRLWHRAADRLLVESYGRAAVVVTSRLHGAIIAVALGKRVVALSKDPKIDDYLTSVGYQEWICEQARDLSCAVRSTDRQCARGDVLDEIDAGNANVAGLVRTAAGTDVA